MSYQLSPSPRAPGDHEKTPKTAKQLTDTKLIIEESHPILLSDEASLKQSESPKNELKKDASPKNNHQATNEPASFALPDDEEVINPPKNEEKTPENQVKQVEEDYEKDFDDYVE